MRARLRVHHQIVQAAPGGFQRLEVRAVHDLIQLQAEEFVELRDARLDRRHRVAADHHAFIQHLADECLNQILGVGSLRRVARHLPVLHDLVEQRGGGRGGGGSRGGRFGLLLFFRHLRKLLPT